MNIYIANIEELDNASYNKAIGLVSEYRRTKVDKLKLEQERRRSLLAGLLLNYATKQYISNNTRTANTITATSSLEVVSVKVREVIEQYDSSFDYPIKTNKYGKPYYDNQYYFSLSHSGLYVVCVVSDRPIGIDIDGDRKSMNITHYLRLARRYFSPREVRWIQGSYESMSISKQEQATPAHCKQRIPASLLDTEYKNLATRFFTIWTLKEAYSKATGLGIAKEISSIEFDIDNHKCYTIQYDTDMQEVIYFDSIEYGDYNLSAVQL